MTFNQPVEIFAGDYPDIFLMEDQDGDGTGDHILEESEMGYFSGVLSVDANDSNNVIININDYLEEEAHIF